MAEKYDYDAIIIGAGIGGLVCGCYLAKNKLKVLLLEQHSSPGGYCTSFLRKGYRFDTSVHYLGGIKHGSLSKILSEIEIKNELKFNQFDPSDKIILPDSCTYIRANPYDTIKEFKKSFPKEKANIEKFFKFVMDSNTSTLYRKLINLSFKTVLDLFFNGKNLKSTFEILLLGNMGLSLNKISGFVSAIFIREFLLDSGYYPVGGMQEFANCLVKKIKFNEGKVLLSTRVEKIVVKDNKVNGVIISSGEKIKAKFVISNIDATETFRSLLNVKTKESRIINSLNPSNSVFTVYAGLNTSLRNISKEACNIWISSVKNTEICYKELKDNIRKLKIPFVMISFPSSHDLSLNENIDKTTIQIYTMATFENQKFWEKNRQLFSDRMLSLTEKILPEIKKYIVFQTTATPQTYYKFTTNRNGSAFGWASTIRQTDTNLLPQNSSIRNLFLAGHWCIMGAGQGGISTVAISGKKAAERIINLIQKK